MANRLSWLGLFVCASLSGGQAEPLPNRTYCFAETLGTFEIEAAIDGRTLRLRDGREVLLAGIETPGADHAAQAALQRVIAGNKVTLRKAGDGDRYGRLAVHAFVQQGGAEHWVQEDLLAAGLVQAAVVRSDATCAKALLAAEAPARRSKLGVWADSHYGIRASDDLPGLQAAEGRFIVAEGKVVSVRESGGTLYMNFGRVWSRNLTVTILRRNRTAFATAGLDPKKLEGARVRVRGWVEDRGGPRIEAFRPEQIEIADQEE